jgi:transcriptional regulator with XRE-family HTH domain
VKQGKIAEPVLAIVVSLLSTHMTRRQQLIASLQDEEYRHALVDQHIASLLPFQLRAMREQRGWTQQELGDRCGKKQEWISKLENPRYARFTLQTLRTLARAFDVALEVKFIPFSQMIDWFSARRPGDLRVPPYSDDAGLAIGASEASAVNLSATTSQVNIVYGQSQTFIAGSVENQAFFLTFMVPSGSETGAEKQILNRGFVGAQAQLAKAAA